MPELPEVEIIKRILEPQLVGRTNKNLALNRTDIIEHPMPDAFASALTGAKITRMSRRGKYINIYLSDDSRVILHLRMTGCIMVTPPDYPNEKHTHLVITLDNGNELRYIDPRRFGRLWLFQKDENDTVSGIHRLGPEPFHGEITAKYLLGVLSKRKRSIKSCLLDQSIIAGIGNIYADEILFAAKIPPDRIANTLAIGACKRLADAIPAVISHAVEANAMTPEEYLAGKGRDYRNTSNFQVYGHAGAPCPVCSETLCRITVAGRGSVYCPSCQGALSW